MYRFSEYEQDRLHQLWQYRIAGTAPEQRFDLIAEMTARLFDAPIALISFVDADRIWLKARIGLAAPECPRAVGFCAHAIASDDTMVVHDLQQDERFRSNPLVVGEPHARFYAGVPLKIMGGHRLGTLCIMDTVPRAGFSALEEARLRTLAAFVIDHLELRRLQSVNAAVRGFADATSDAMLCIDRDGTLTFVNQATTLLFGYTADEMIGHKLDIIVPERFRGAHAAGVSRVATGNASRLAGKTVELSAIRRNGQEFPIEIAICSWQDQHGIQMGALVRDISERKERDLRLHRLASHDALTGLSNRSSFERQLAEAYANGEPSAVLLLDLDSFKSVNDSLGHAAGDSLLQALAVRFKAAVDPSAVLARIGGDEFAVVLPNTDDATIVRACAEGILTALEAPFLIAGHSMQIGVSIGAAIGPHQGNDAEELVASADLALYRAKADGRRRFCFYEPAMRHAIKVRRALQDQLLRAVSGGELVLHYQPQIDLRTKCIIGVEALLRWQHPERGLLYPGAFISALEKHALAAEVGNWVIEQACRQAALWQAAGLPRLRLGVNLFAAQIRSGLLVPAVIAALERHGIAPGGLELEITETIALQDDDGMLAPLREVHNLGVGLAFDDFGTGYASLSTLKRVPLTTLKIDRSFIQDVHTNVQDAAVVEALIGMGRTMALNVIAEGIESSEQEAVLQRLGCRAGQGFRYGCAMPADQLTCSLKNEIAAQAYVADQPPSKTRTTAQDVF